MRSTLVALILLVTLWPTSARAEEPTPSWTSGQAAANWISTGFVAANIIGETAHAWRAPDRGHALRVEALRVGLAVSLSEVTKRLVHRSRPDGSDRESFFSEHTAIAFASGGWNVSVSIPIGMGAGYLRMAADKHHPSDVLVGALVGTLLARIH